MLMDALTKLKKWCLAKPQGYAHGPGVLFSDTIVFFLLLVTTAIIYNYLWPLNEYVFILVRFGSFLLLTSTVCLLIYAIKMTGHLVHGIAGVRNLYKLLLTIAIILGIFYLYINQAAIVPRAVDYASNIPFEDLYPLTIGLRSVQQPAMFAEPGLNQNTYLIETLVFRSINGERTRRGLPGLAWDPLLADVARQHSLDMARNNYFAHQDLAGLMPGERVWMRAQYARPAWYGYRIGENIGVMPIGRVEGYGLILSPEEVADTIMAEWMASPSHRSNILEENYDFVGVGVAFDGIAAYYGTQNFK